MKTTLTELPDSRVRLQVQVPADELEGRLERKARQLGRELKLPGFRRGKVPAPLVIQRIGREAVLEEAVRDTLSSWYADAIENAGIVPVGDPQLDLGELPPPGEALEFSIEIGVLPKAELGEYQGLEVARREPAVDRRADRAGDRGDARAPGALADGRAPRRRGRLRRRRLRRLAAPAEASDAEQSQGEQARVPLPGGEGRDQLVELGAGKLIPGFEQGLIGASAGETRTVELSFPDDYANAELAGREASFEVTVKEVKRKQLPAVDDDFAIDAGFDTMAELREDLRSRLLEADEGRIEAEFRQAALDAAVAKARVDVTPELVKARAREMWERMLHSLSHRGISREAYLQIVGPRRAGDPHRDGARRRAGAAPRGRADGGRRRGGDQRLRGGAAGGRRRRAPSARASSRRSCCPTCARAGASRSVREDLAARKAVELIAAQATPISVAQAQAREELWTPGQGGPEGRRRGRSAASAAAPRSDRAGCGPRPIRARTASLYGQLASRGIRRAKRNQERGI